MVLRTVVTAPTATITMSEQSNAYSSRSCPLSDASTCHFFFNPLMSISALLRPGGLRRALQLARNRRKNAVNRLARVGHRHDGHERDQRHEHRVFEQLLARVVAHDPARAHEQLLHIGLHVQNTQFTATLFGWLRKGRRATYAAARRQRRVSSSELTRRRPVPRSAAGSQPSKRCC